MKNAIDDLFEEFRARLVEIVEQAKRDANDPVVRVVDVEDDVIVAETVTNGAGPHIDAMTILRVVEERARSAAAIAKELGVPTPTVSVELKKLVKNGVVRTEGQKRGTTYHPVSAV
jgi:predicted transcriptional regulator